MIYTDINDIIISELSFWGVFMKNFFGIDVTDSKTNSTPESDAFVTKRTSETLKKRIAESNAVDKNFSQKSASAIAGLISIISIIVGLIAARKFIYFAFNWGITQALDAHFISFIVLIVCIAACFGGFLYNYHKKNKVEQSDEFKEHLVSLNNIMNELMDELGVPRTSPILDFLMSKFKIKNGKLKNVNFGACTHANTALFVYTKDGYLCLANRDEVIEIPLSSLRDAKLSKKKATFMSWNKKEAFNSPKYKKFKITKNDRNEYSAKYYAVEIQDAKGEFELLIPVYDFETFADITHIKCEI